MVGQDISLPTILSGLNTGITLHDPETGAVLDINDQLEQLYGYSASEMRTMTVEDYTAPSTRFTQAEAVRRIRAAAAGDPQSFEWQIERKNGEYRWVSVHLTQTTIDGEIFVLAEISDITEYRVRDRLLRLLNRVIRHNLRNDMNVLIGYADRIKTAVENDQLEEEVETILDIASEVGTLSDSLSQIEQVIESDATRREPTNLGTVARDRAVKVKKEYPEIGLSVDAPSDVWVIADKGLEHAVDRALDNAITHNDHELQEIEVMVTVTDDPDKNAGIIQISDNGPPIPDVEINVLDNEGETNSTFHGSGVGLWVMKWCAESLGGGLSFEENTPRGNIVQMSLPKAAPSASEI